MFTDRAHPQFLTSLSFRCHISSRICSVPDQHSCQSRFLFPRFHTLRYRNCNLSAHLLCDKFSINQLSSHMLSLITILPVILSPRYSFSFTSSISFHLGEAANAVARK